MTFTWSKAGEPRRASGHRAWVSGLASSCALSALLVACSDRGLYAPHETPSASTPEASADGGLASTQAPSVSSLTIVTQDPSDLPLAGLSDHWQARFLEGDATFDQVFRSTQGLGPVYIRQSCASCHTADARGPGASRKMVNVEADGITPSGDQSMFPYGHTVRPQSIAPETYPGVDEPAPFDGLLVSSRLGPAVFARGAMEAILDSEIERLEAEQAQRDDGISGRINRVTYNSESNPDSPFNTFAKGDGQLIGRFGLKARLVTLDEFAADAYQGDMGITSPLRPTELPNPAGATDDALPGVDIGLETINLTGDYVRLIRMPARKVVAPEGRMLFEEADCGVCHASGLQTAHNYPIEPWAGTRVDVYTDLLLHAMGKDLADGIAEGDAKGDEWRTAPLMGIRHLRALMHDGRAKTVRDAILSHASEGSEANGSVEKFETLSAAEQQLLIDFVESL